MVGITKGLLQGIATQNQAQHPLHREGVRRPSKIHHHIEGVVVAVPDPAQGKSRGMGSRKSHVVRRAEGTELTFELHNKTLSTQS